MRLGLEHSYAALPERFYARLAPVPVREPALVKFNAALASELDVQSLAGAESQALAALFAGNALPEDARPVEARPLRMA